MLVQYPYDEPYALTMLCSRGHTDWHADRRASSQPNGVGSRQLNHVCLRYLTRCGCTLNAWRQESADRGD